MTEAALHELSAPNDPRVFTLAEAQALFPLVRRITQASYEELAPVRQRLEVMVPTDPRIAEVERQYEAVVKRWVGKMERLGLVVKGLWLIDFDGYLCWRFPELRINHYHAYHEGFAGRRPLVEIVEELDPDWARA
jgi:hypothetical protein